MMPPHNEQFCSSSRRSFVNLRSLLVVNDENLLKFNAEIEQKCHCVEAS